MPRNKRRKSFLSRKKQTPAVEQEPELPVNEVTTPAVAEAPVAARPAHQDSRHVRVETSERIIPGLGRTSWYEDVDDNVDFMSDPSVTASEDCHTINSFMGAASAANLLQALSHSDISDESPGRIVGGYRPGGKETSPPNSPSSGDVFRQMRPDTYDSPESPPAQPGEFANPISPQSFLSSPGNTSLSSKEMDSPSKYNRLFHMQFTPALAAGWISGNKGARMRMVQPKVNGGEKQALWDDSKGVVKEKLESYDEEDENALLIPAFDHQENDNTTSQLPKIRELDVNAEACSPDKDPTPKSSGSGSFWRSDPIAASITDEKLSPDGQPDTEIYDESSTHRKYQESQKDSEQHNSSSHERPRSPLMVESNDFLENLRRESVGALQMSIAGGVHEDGLNDETHRNRDRSMAKLEHTEHITSSTIHTDTTHDTSNISNRMALSHMVETDIDIDISMQLSHDTVDGNKIVAQKSSQSESKTRRAEYQNHSADDENTVVRPRRKRSFSSTGKPVPGHRRTRSGDEAAATLMTGGTDWAGMEHDRLPLPPIPGEQDDEDDDENEEAELVNAERFDEVNQLKKSGVGSKAGIGGIFGRKKSRPSQGEPKRYSSAGSASGGSFLSERQERRAQKEKRRQEQLKKDSIDGLNDPYLLSDTSDENAASNKLTGKVPTKQKSSVKPGFAVARGMIPSGRSNPDLNRLDSPGSSPSQFSQSKKNPPAGSYKRHGSESSLESVNDASVFSWISKGVSVVSSKVGNRLPTRVAKSLGTRTLNLKQHEESGSDHSDHSDENHSHHSEPPSHTSSTDYLLPAENPQATLDPLDHESSYHEAEWSAPSSESSLCKRRRRVSEEKHRRIAEFEKHVNSFSHADRSTFKPRSSYEDQEKNKTFPTFICPRCSTRQRQYVTVANAVKQFESPAGYLAFYFGIYVIAALFIFGLEEGWQPLDCVYFSVITLTTAGLGDFVPSSDGAKIICSIFIYFGVACIGLLMGSLLANSLDEAAGKEAMESMVDNCPNCDRLLTIRKLQERSGFTEKKISTSSFEKNMWKSERRLGEVEYNLHSPTCTLYTTDNRTPANQSRNSHPSENSRSNLSTPFGPMSTPDEQHVSFGSPNLSSPRPAERMSRQMHIRHTSIDIYNPQLHQGEKSRFADNTSGRTRNFSANFSSRHLEPAIDETAPLENIGSARTNSRRDALGLGNNDEDTNSSGSSSSASTNFDDSIEPRKRKMKAAKFVFLTLKQAVMNSVLIICVGAVGFYFIEDMSPVDSFYFTTVLLTTVGYGDIVPVTNEGKAFATVYVMIAGTILLYNMSLISMIPLELRKRRVERAVLSQVGSDDWCLP